MTLFRKLWLVLCGGTMSACFSSLENFEKRIESLMSSNVNFAKKSAFFVSRLVLISSFRAAFFVSRLWKDFWLLRCQFNWTYWELFLALINLILGRSLYLSSIFKIGSCFDESEHLYPLLAIYIQNGMKTIKFVWKSISKFSSFSFAPPRFNRFCLRCSP